MNKETKELLNEFMRLGREKKFYPESYDEELLTEGDCIYEDSAEKYAVYAFILKLKERGIGLIDFDEPWRCGTKIVFNYLGKTISLQVKNRKGTFTIFLSDYNNVLVDDNFTLSNFMRNDFIDFNGVRVSCDYDTFYEDDMSEEEQEQSINKKVLIPFLTRFLEDIEWVRYLYSLLENPLVNYKLDFEDKTFTKQSVCRDVIHFESNNNTMEELPEIIKNSENLEPYMWSHADIPLTDKFDVHVSFRGYANKENKVTRMLVEFHSISSKEELNSFKKECASMYLNIQDSWDKGKDYSSKLLSILTPEGLKKIMKYVNYKNVTFYYSNWEPGIRCSVVYTKEEVYPIPSGLDTPSFYKE